MTEEDTLHENIDTIEESTDKDISQTNNKSEKETRPSQKVKLSEDVYIHEPINEDLEILSLPSHHDFEVKSKLNSTPNISLSDTPQSRKWKDTLEESVLYTTYAETFVPTIEDQKSQFEQYIDFNNNKLAAQAPKIKASENENIKGEKAVLRVIRQLGLGTTFQVPLWHSGIWITLKPPSEATIIELNRLLATEKIQLGRSTYGLVYGNTSSYTVNYLLDTILSHIYATSVKNEELTVAQLKDHILVQDLYILIWAFACTMYPKGFQYRRACVNDAVECNHIVEEKINLTKLHWTNTFALTEWQKSHMSSRQPFIKELKSIQKYKDELISVKSKKITLIENELYVSLKSPTITEYINEGYLWVSGIVDKVNKTIEENATEQERNIIMSRYSQTSSMRQYAHWVESFELSSNIIDDKETINSTLDVMSSDDNIRVKFLKEVANFINDSTISLIGIPIYECPKCGKEQNEDNNINKEFIDIIPLDVIQLFFGLTTQRIQKIVRR